MDKVAVLIPCYNEAKTIEKVVSDYKKILPGGLFMSMIITQRMELVRLRQRRGR